MMGPRCKDCDAAATLLVVNGQSWAVVCENHRGKRDVVTTVSLVQQGIAHGVKGGEPGAQERIANALETIAVVLRTRM